MKYCKRCLYPPLSIGIISYLMNKAYVWDAEYMKSKDNIDWEKRFNLLKETVKKNTDNKFQKKFEGDFVKKGDILALFWK